MFLRQRHLLNMSQASYRSLPPVSVATLLVSGQSFLHIGAILDLSARVEVSRNHYQVLGVERNATKKEIRNAFVALSKKYHPDSNPDPHLRAVRNSQAFVEVSEAYHTLSHPKRRAQYDSELMVAETYRTQYEQRFYRGSNGPLNQPFRSQDTHEHSRYSTGGGHSYQYYDRSEVDWGLNRNKPKHARVVYMLLALTVIVPALFMLRVNHNYHKYYRPAALQESQRNVAAYRAVRDKARNSSVQDQLDLLVRRHSERVKTSDVNHPPKR